MHRPQLNRFLVEDAVRSALKEDLGMAGDLTTEAIIPRDAKLEATVIARKDGCLAGQDFVLTAMAMMDSSVTAEVLVTDGSKCTAGEELTRLSGPARSILSAERVGLNFMGRLSGIATTTQQIIDAVGNLPVRVTCTRKTTPGLRAFEKYAVRCGGGHNHRFGLFDAVMIKDNHVAAVGGKIGDAIKAAREAVGHLVKIELEVDTLEQLEQALPFGPDVVLLDNMTPETLKEAVRLVKGRAITEASGSITPQTARAYAESGVDVLSLGWLTHSAPNFDVGLDIAF
ncbi:carboxylating nicotinate-nucleotide diphosphorylase [Kiloniella sp. b19]|uniref:carboxylating nicotinate-nucleotide diphosphorylase n=1 Tax=Kiloniella sp. GXU_MW_B19 TaxID=3141326 RepID=UPI0031DEAAD3